MDSPRPMYNREDKHLLLARARAARDHARDLISVSAIAARLSAARIGEAELVMALSQHTLEELRTSVCAYAALLREAETPPERAIIDIKSMVRDAVSDTGPRSEAMTALVVRWAVDAYYAA